VPDRSKRYHRKVIFDRLKITPYDDAALAFAPNAADTGLPGDRRPGLAILSRNGCAEEPEIIQDLGTPLVIPFGALRGSDGDAGAFTLRRLSRPILKARIPMGGAAL